MGRSLRVFAILLAISLARSAEAITFTDVPVYALGNASVVPGGALSALSTANGFVFTGDVRVTGQPASVTATRKFDVGPIPEAVTVSASENWKLVISGGGDAPATPATFTVQTTYFLLDLASANSASASGAGFTQIGNGFHVTSDPLHALVFDSSFPASQILTPGSYQIQAFISLIWEPSSPAAPFSEGAFLEFGGLTDFDGFTVDVHGTPVPEPASAGLLGIGLVGLGWIARRRR